MKKSLLQHNAVTLLIVLLYAAHFSSINTFLDSVTPRKTTQNTLIFKKKVVIWIEYSNVNSRCISPLSIAMRYNIFIGTSSGHIILIVYAYILRYSYKTLKQKYHILY